MAPRRKLLGEMSETIRISCNHATPPSLRRTQEAANRYVRRSSYEDSQLQ